MARTAIILGMLIIATLFLPVWVQLLLYAAGCFVVPYRIALFVPASLADALYAPHQAFATGHWYVLYVAALLAVHWALVRFTRIGQWYDESREF